MIHHQPTYWPHSGMWILPDGRSAPTVRALDAQLDHRRECVADWRPVGGAALHSQTERVMSRRMSQQESAYHRARERKFRVVRAEPMSADELARAPTETTKKPAIPHAAMMNSKAAPRRRRAPPPVLREPLIPGLVYASRRWTTEEDDRLLSMRRSGASCSNVARALRRSTNSVIGRVHRGKGK